MRQIAECFEIGRLTICRETTDFRIHLLYQQSITDPLCDAGYEIQTEEIHISGLNEDFSELQYALYEGNGCDIYLFRGLAVRADEKSIKYHAEGGLTKDTLTRIWNESDIDWDAPAGEYDVLLDRTGNMPIKMEKTIFDSWDLLMRAPGEVEDAEERIAQVQRLYNDIRQEGSADLIIDALKEHYSDWIGEWSTDLDSLEPEYQEYVRGMIDDGNRFITQLESLRGEYVPVLNQAETHKTEA